MALIIDRALSIKPEPGLYLVYQIRYGVATISRLLKIIGLFCRISPFNRSLLQKRPIILRSLLIVATPYDKTCLVQDRSTDYSCLYT